MQYLVQLASGSFQILTGEQLLKELESPPRIYRLIPDSDPERLWAVWGKDVTTFTAT